MNSDDTAVLGLRRSDYVRRRDDGRPDGDRIASSTSAVGAFDGEVFGVGRTVPSAGDLPVKVSLANCQEVGRATSVDVLEDSYL
jgi:hypothetical protein